MGYPILLWYFIHRIVQRYCTYHNMSYCHNFVFLVMPRILIRKRTISFLPTTPLVVLVMFCWLCLFLPLQAQRIEFERHSLEQGLSHAAVNCVIQDKKGFIWVGTQDGLNCWDGHSFTVYRHDPADSTTLSHSFVRSLYEDAEGRLWIGTLWGFNLFNPQLKNFERYYCAPNEPIPNPLGYTNSIRAIAKNNLGLLAIGSYGDGLQIFDPTTKTFEAFLNKDGDSTSLSNNRVCSLLTDRKGNLWVGTEGGGLSLFNPKTKAFTHFKNNPKNSSSLSNNHVYSIFEDRKGQLWIGTANGLNVFDPSNKTFERFTHQLKVSTSLSANFIYAIHEDHKGRMWVGTQDGLNLFDRATKTFRVLRNDPKDIHSLSNNVVNFIFETKAGQLIIGTHGGGINLLNGRAEQFSTFSNDPSDARSLSNNLIWAILEDQNNQVWVGTNKGLNLFNSKQNSFENYRHKTTTYSWLSDLSIASLLEDKEGRLWVGTSSEGLIVYNPKTNSLERFRHNPENPSSLADNRIPSLFEDRAGTIWVGTNKGLSKFNSVSKSFQNFSNYPPETRHLEPNIINSIFEDKAGHLWLGTNGGLSRFDQGKGIYTNFIHNAKDSTSISSNNAFCVYEDDQERLWIATQSGLNYFDRQKQSFYALHFGQESPNDVFYAVLEDEKGRLWCTTNNGIVRFTPALDFAPDQGRWGELKNYTAQDGIQNNEFNTGAYFRGKSGKMYFGGINGFSFFHPDSIKDDLIAPPVFLTDLEIFNESVVPGKSHNGFILPTSITEAEELVLSYRESVFTIKFAALSFTQADKNKYAYQLIGFDKSWNYTDAQRRFATYTNLNPGTYTFRVKGANRDGVWNEEGATLTIIITPPWWKTWWSRILLVLGLIGAVALLLYLRTNRINQLNQALKVAVMLKTNELEEKNEELIVQTTMLEQKNNELERAKGQLEFELQYQHQRQLLKQSIDVQEEERKRIAQDLHDELGAVLSIARMHLVHLEGIQTEKENRQGLQQARTLTENALLTMRRISHELMPLQLQKYGLIKTLEALAKQINDANKISVELLTPEDEARWSKPAERGLYRMIMEMINNTIKHAQADRIQITIHQSLDHLVVTYADNGTGLPENHSKGLGLQNIDARINALGGTFEILPVAKGFSARIIIPL